MSEGGYAFLCGLDVGRSAHHAVALDPTGKRLHDAALPQDEARLRQLFTALQTHERLLVAVDQPATIGALPVAVALATGGQVAYLPGLAMRRIADLHCGSAKTDARDASVIAEAARTMPYALRRVDAAGDRGACQPGKREGREPGGPDQPGTDTGCTGRSGDDHGSQLLTGAAAGGTGTMDWRRCRRTRTVAKAISQTLHRT
jgi:hypothetical protein